MKPFHFFCLNLFGLASVRTQTQPPDLDRYPADCKLTMAGSEYAGPLSVTRSGRTCLRWDSDQPHSHRYKNSTLFPEGNASGAGNKCRNPDNENEGVWCYTTDPNTAWEYCNVDFCDCKLTKAGHEYAGPLSVTRSGFICQPWNSDQPHSHRFKNSTFFPEGSASAAGNKCRNPDGKHNKGVWCYTTDPNKRWEECDVKFCGIDCKLTKAGHEYAGPLSVTRSGRTCQGWDSDQPHANRFQNSTLFPDGSASAAGNKCRNPDYNINEGVWCYTTDPTIRWEECDVEFCGVDCKLTTAGHEYAGSLSVTRSGRTCQRWNSNQPHSTSFKNSTLFPEGSASDAGNKCRNPDSSHIEGVWCYTTDPKKRWEECDVKLCDFISAAFPTRPQKFTTSSQTSRIQTGTSSHGTTLSSTMEARSVPHSPTRQKAFETSTANRMAFPPSTISHSLATEEIEPSSQSSQENTSLDENSSTNVVMTVIPVVGATALISVIVVIVVWRRTRCLQCDRTRSRADGNLTMATSGKFMHSDGIDNPDYEHYHQLVEIVDVTTDHIEMSDSALAYKPADKFRLS